MWNIDVRAFEDSSVEPTPTLYSEQLNVGAAEMELNTGTSPERLKPSHLGSTFRPQFQPALKICAFPRVH